MGVGIPAAAAAAAAAAWAGKALSAGRGVAGIDAVMNELGNFGLGNLPEWTEFTEYSYSDLSRGYPTWDPPHGSDHIDNSHVGNEPRPDQGGRVNDWLEDIDPEFDPREIETLDDLAGEVGDAVEGLEGVGEEAGLTTRQMYDMLRNLQDGFGSGPGSSTSGAEGASSAMEAAENAAANALDGGSGAPGSGVPGGGGSSGGGSEGSGSNSGGSSERGGSNGGSSNGGSSEGGSSEGGSSGSNSGSGSSNGGSNSEGGSSNGGSSGSSNGGGSNGGSSNGGSSNDGGSSNGGSDSNTPSEGGSSNAPSGVDGSNTAGGGSNGAGGDSSATGSSSAETAADVASSGAGPGAVADALLQAGVPAINVASTLGAISNAIKALPNAGPSNAARNAALKVISEAITPQGAAVSAAASAVLGGASGEAVAKALREAGVPEDAIDSTVRAVNDAIEGARAAGETNGAKLMTAAIDAIWRMPDPVGELSRALLNVVGASYNFWYMYPRAVYRSLQELEKKEHGRDSELSRTLAEILADGPPPEMGPLMDIKFPFRRLRIRGYNLKVWPGKVPDKATDTSPPAPPEPTQPAVPPGMGHCDNLTDAQFGSALSIEVSDDMYEYGSVNKTYLAEWLRNDPAAFNDLRTNGVPVSMCWVQFRLKYTPVSEDERRRFNLVFHLLEQLESGLNQVSRGVDGLEPAPPATGGEHQDRVFDHRNYFIKVPKLSLPSFGHMCPHVDDILTWEILPEDDSPLWEVEAWEKLVDDSVDLFKHHEYTYMLYMEVHLAELSAALEILQDAECYLRGFLEKYPDKSERPGKPTTRHETLERVQAMLKRFRKIQVDPWKV